MTQADKQQYKYKVTGDSFKYEDENNLKENKKDNSLKYIAPVILFAVIYLISRI